MCTLADTDLVYYLGLSDNGVNIMRKINVGIIGFGRMGEKYLKTMLESGRWNISYICDTSPIARDLASEIVPEANIIDDEDMIFRDSEVEAVVLSALADSRKGQIGKAVKYGKHILAEKPIAANIEEEEAAINMIKDSEVISTVNLYLRNSWYHHTMKDFISSGEIGEPAIIRICHMTPGLAPGEGHEYEGPPFHDCGMHYVDIARWYAESEYDTWHSQALRMWDWEEPWWLQCHGTFKNGVVFDITQGFVYGQLAKDQTHNSYTDIIGTKGIVRMTHDFKTAVVDMRGITLTKRIEKPFGGKNIAVICNDFADSILEGKRRSGLPKMEDAFVASEISWKMLEDAGNHKMPSIGDNKTLEAIRERRSKMTEGYGLLKKR